MALAILGASASVATAVLVASSDVLTHPQLNAGIRSLAITLFVGIGVYTHWRRPDSAAGLLLAGIGAIFSLTTLMALRAPLLFTLGRVALASLIVFTAYAFVCFPSDRLSGSVACVFIRVAALSSAVVWALTLALARQLPTAGPVAQCAVQCPDNALQIANASPRCL